MIPSEKIFSHHPELVLPEELFNIEESLKELQSVVARMLHPLETG